MTADDRTLIALLSDAVIKGRIPDGEAVTRRAIAAGIPPLRLIEEALGGAMDHVGQLFRDEEYFIPEVLLSARTVHGAMRVLTPLIVGQEQKPVGVAVIATVEGDIHDIGKNLVCTLLRAAHFQVHDLGVDQKAEAVVEAAQKHGADIVGLSALLSVTMPNIEKTIAAFEKAGVRKSHRIICGGAPVTARFAVECGADGYAPSAPEAVVLCRQWGEPAVG